MKWVRVFTVSGIVLAAALAAAVWSIHVRVAGLGSTLLGQKVTLAVSAVYLVLSIETVLLFWAGLKSFKTNLKLAYLILCAAIIMFAIAQIQVPLTTISGLEWWTTTGLVTLPYMLSSMLAFWSLRTFARLLDIKDMFTQFRVVVPVILVLIAITFFLPVHLSALMPTAAAHHAFTAIVVWELIFDGLAAYNAWRIRQVIGGRYLGAVTWLFVAFFSYTLVHVHFGILQIIGYDNWYGQNSFEILPLTLVALLLVRAGYAFWQISGDTKTAVSASPMDVVIYTANLATNRREIEPIIHTVRTISTHMVPGGQLPAHDQEELGRVYLKLEQYLVEQERLRYFTRSGLRQHIERTFLHEPGQFPAFWAILT